MYIKKDHVIYIVDEVSLENAVSKYYVVLKRLFDVIISLFSIILLIPLFIIIAIIIKLESSGSVFFIQDRCGYKGKVFKYINFVLWYITHLFYKKLLRIAMKHKALCLKLKMILGSHE